MNRKLKFAIAGVAVVGILTAAVATTAFAASWLTGPAPTAAQAARLDTTTVAVPTAADYQAWGCPVADGDYEAIANLLGITPQELEAQLDQGKSLAEIAAGKGVSEDKLVATIIAPMKEHMQQFVSDGNWTQAQLDTRLKLAEQHIRQLVNAKGDADDYGGCGAIMNGSGTTIGRGGMMGGGWSSGGMMGGWGANGATPASPGGGTNSSGSFGRGGMMGGGYGGTTGGGFGGMMGGW